ncbi:5'-methylthioadenosine/S-adenosylhomocysteine nucleosidase [Candidatus Bipolaricaulota bacterium]
MIAILGALREEVSWLRRRMDVQETISEAGCTLWRGTFQGRDVVLAQTGMGKQRAQAATRLIIERYPIATLVSFGFAGALAEELNAGDVVLYSAVHCEQADANSAVHCADAAADAVADPAGSPLQSFASSDDMIAHAKRVLEGAAVRFFYEPGVSVRHVVLSPEDRGRLAEAHGVSVVDMESYWIAEIAAERQIPCVILRSVSDTKHETLLPFDQLMNEDGVVLWRAAAAHFIRRPRDLAVIGRLYRNTRLAKRKLAVAMDALIAKL